MRQQDELVTKLISFVSYRSVNTYVIGRRRLLKPFILPYFDEEETAKCTRNSKLVITVALKIAMEKRIQVPSLLLYTHDIPTQGKVTQFKSDIQSVQAISTPEMFPAMFVNMFPMYAMQIPNECHRLFKESIKDPCLVNCESCKRHHRQLAYEQERTKNLSPGKKGVEKVLEVYVSILQRINPNIQKDIKGMQPLKSIRYLRFNYGFLPLEDVAMHMYDASFDPQQYVNIYEYIPEWHSVLTRIVGGKQPTEEEYGDEHVETQEDTISDVDDLGPEITSMDLDTLMQKSV